MPILLLIGVGAGASWLIGRAVNDTGSGAIKIAAAGAALAASAILLKRAGVI